MTIIQPPAIPGSAQEPLNRRFCVAPMIDWTDRHCRFFHRLISKRAVLYTEMISTGALIHGDTDQLLDHDAREHPLALQLGGNDPKQLTHCAKLGEQRGYSEINLNCGCPSDRVQQGRFGASLMAKPDLVASCMAAMREAVDIPVTIKHRIGIDRQTSYEKLADFVGAVAETGCRTFIVHARMAWLDGLSPKQNRHLPPLQYELVYRLKRDFPACEIIINGGITGFKEITEHLHRTDGVMLGREAYKNPFLLASVDHTLYGEGESTIDRLNVLEQMIPYVENQLQHGIRLNRITRHILGLFHGQHGGKKFRRFLGLEVTRADAGIEVLAEALMMMQNYTLQTQDNNDAEARLAHC